MHSNTLTSAYLDEVVRADMGCRFSDLGSFPVSIEKPETSEPKEEEKATAGAGSLLRELWGPREGLSSVPRV